MLSTLLLIKEIKIASRASPLAQAQVWEVLAELQRFFSEVRFDPTWVVAYGDKDLATSLRDLDKSDFFTREVDALVLSGACRIAIHSAKDLPDPLPQGLTIAVLTRGVDSADALVLREGESLEKLPQGAKIGSSSIRREEAIRALRSDLEPVDIRGTINSRLEQLDRGLVDGVIMAEAALIRLKLTHRNRLRLQGEAAPLQGRLAIIAREEDREMIEWLQVLNG